ncbi:Major facilitator superfamily domain-containing protein 7 [Cichlidogyrus casuarinus]|uniref:Major facilitator superfamily domain-containing protein 7 n=1 Tax=Cichlidogyrus casuarinus TaxID=1844966 RepID=A0ABD2Q9N1_9PLAT
MRVTQIVASFGQPLCMFVPTRLAFLWFPDKQRATANSLSALGNPLGVMLNSLLLPVFIKNVDQLPRNNYSTFALSIFALIISIPASIRKYPPTCPSRAAQACHEYEEMRQRQPFWQTIRIFFKNVKEPFKLVGFWLLLFQFGFALCYFTLVSNLLQQMLCTKGYSNEFAGIVGAIMIAGGLLMGVIMGPIIDKTGYLLPGVVICYVIALLGAIAFSAALFFTNLQWLITLSLLWLGSFGLSSYSLSLELAAEATYPVPEAITTGLLIMFSQFLVCVLIPLIMLGGRKDPTHSVCGKSSTPMDYSIPNIVIVCLGVLLGVINSIFMRLPYKRRDLAARRRSTLSPDSTIPIIEDVSENNDDESSNSSTHELDAQRI